MNDQKENIVNNKSACSIDSVLNDFFNCSDAAELTQKSFEIFRSIFNFYSVSIFLLDKKSFEFIHFQTEGRCEPENVIKYFNTLVSNGSVAESINRENILNDQLIIDDKPCFRYMLKPLSTKDEILGMLVFLTECDVEPKEDSIEFLNMVSKVFTTLLRNFELKREIERVKEESEYQIIERTNEIVQSSRELKTILDYLHIGIFITDCLTGEISDVNLMGQKIIGLSKENIIGKKRSEFFFFADSYAASSQIASITEGLLQINGGGIVPILHKTTEIKLSQSEFLLDNFLDISERKKMELELQFAHDELEERVIERTKELSDANENLQIQIKERIKAEEETIKLNWALHQSPTMIIITNIDGNIEYVNPSFLKITGYELDEILGKNPRILKSGQLPNDKYQEMWKSISKGIDWKDEYLNKKKNGEVFWVSATISPIKNQEGIITNYLAVQEDITEKKIAEQELIVAKERAETSSKFKTKLLATMSHEFRTPLISIFGFADILIDELTNNEDIELVNEISHASNRLLTTLNSILLLSQLESMEEKINLEKMDITKQVKNLLAPYAVSAEAKKLKLNYLPTQDPVFISIDKNLFDQMTGSIIDNAIKYTSKGNVNVRIIIDVDECLVEIEDTGIGIEESEHESIFEAFKQVSEGYSRNYDGCGLGLALAKKIAESMGGSIGVKSVPSIGSTFTIRLPFNYSVTSD